MVNIGQVLIKIGKLEQFDGWQMKEERELLRRSEFIELMMSPGTPCYSSMKTINEKWRSLASYYGLVEQTFYAFKTVDGKEVPDKDLPPRGYVLNKAAANRLIQDTIPKRIRSNYALTSHYLKTGEVN